MNGLSWLGQLASDYWFVPLIQLFFVVHAIRTGRNWYWVWIIMGFPGLGAAIYFFVEFLPSYPNLTLNSILDATLPGWELKKLQTALEDTNTVQNNKALGDYYMGHGQPDKALPLYRECVKGVFKEDAEMNIRLGSALIELNQCQEARTLLEVLRKRKTGYETSKRDVLYGRSLEGLGLDPEALGVYEDVMARFGSEVEGCCRLARLYVKSGSPDKAKTLYVDLLKRAKHFSPHYRSIMAIWIKAAKKGLKELS